MSVSVWKTEELLFVLVWSKPRQSGISFWKLPSMVTAKYYYIDLDRLQNKGYFS